MVFIHQEPFHVPAAETCFRTSLEASDESSIESVGLLRYFELRQAWDRREYEKIGSEELVFMNQARKKYAGSRYEPLYEEWKNGNGKDSRMVERTGSEWVRTEFLPYQINVDSRTFMVTNTWSPGDKPTEPCFHPPRHSLCHPLSVAITRNKDA